MAEDLEEIHERLDYCQSELATIQRQVEGYRASAIEKQIIRTDEGIELQVRRARSLPTPIRSRVGTTIHEIRSCLDALASCLAERNDQNPKGVYFPISKTAAIFETDGLKKIKKLSANDQKIIIDSKPYGGGRDFWFGMHEFDRTRKHQRLGISYPGFSGLGVSNAKKLHVIRMHELEQITSGWETVAVFSHDTEAQVELTTPVVFKDPPQLARLEVSSAIARFLNEARMMVRNFD